MKYKVGDKAIVVANECNHEFEIGTIVTITDVDRGGYFATVEDGEGWWIGDDELEQINT